MGRFSINDGREPEQPFLNKKVEEFSGFLGGYLTSKIIIDWFFKKLWVVIVVYITWKLFIKPFLGN